MKHIEGEYFHVFNRGVLHQPIFLDRGDYLFLLKKAQTYLPDYKISIIAYCLMPNHYHFLVKTNSDNHLSPFFQRLFNGYTQNFNFRNHRTGTLFEGRMKSRWIDRQEYLLNLARYIHRNPVKAGLVRKAEDWEFSNYQEWIGKRESVLYTPDFVSEWFPRIEEYQSFVEEEVDKNIELPEPYCFDN